MWLMEPMCWKLTCWYWVIYHLQVRLMGEKSVLFIISEVL